MGERDDLCEEPGVMLALVVHFEGESDDFADIISEDVPLEDLRILLVFHVVLL